MLSEALWQLSFCALAYRAVSKLCTNTHQLQHWRWALRSHRHHPPTVKPISNIHTASSQQQKPVGWFSKPVAGSYLVTHPPWQTHAIHTVAPKKICRSCEAENPRWGPGRASDRFPAFIPSNLNLTSPQGHLEQHCTIIPASWNRSTWVRKLSWHRAGVTVLWYDNTLSWIKQMNNQSLWLKTEVVPDSWNFGEVSSRFNNRDMDGSNSKLSGSLCHLLGSEPIALLMFIDCTPSDQPDETVL